LSSAQYSNKMGKKGVYVLGIVLMVFVACGDNDFDGDVEIPDFNFPKTVVFEDSLAAYNIFKGNPANLVPAEGFELLELSSKLFTDYAHKQRLVKIPEGTQAERQSDGTLDFPNGTILTKTFFYYHDERDTSLGKQIVETRLLVKESGTWNVATYVWNESQTAAILELNGLDKQLSWIGQTGVNASTVYHVPTENECMTCHQTSSTLSPIGPTLLNLNRLVVRNGMAINQLKHLQNVGILNDFAVDGLPNMVDYNNQNATLEQRGRAYLAMNCAHCHNPCGWETPAETDFDFRYQIPLDETGIPFGGNQITEVLVDEEMPFIGTTMLDDEGVALILEYLDNL